jgi:hypothetical protein
MFCLFFYLIILTLNIKEDLKIEKLSFAFPLSEPNENIVIHSESSDKILNNKKSPSKESSNKESVNNDQINKELNNVENNNESNLVNPLSFSSSDLFLQNIPHPRSPPPEMEIGLLL